VADMKKNYLLKFFLIVLVIALDLVTKEIFYGQDITFIPQVISCRDAGALNTGGAWGIMGDSPWILVAFTFIFLVLVVVLEMKWKNDNMLYSIALSFVVGGALGNLIDRIFLGGVRDFLFFEFWVDFPTFNVADSFLCVGVVLLAIFILFIDKEEKGESK
jgi:signal peptidase II